MHRLIFVPPCFQQQLGDNWTLVEELLKLTCNPKVSTASRLEKRTIGFHIS